jgi:hypothetical protein
VKVEPGRNGLPAAVLPSTDPLEVVIGASMVVGRVGAQTAHDVGADGRGFVGGSAALEFVDHLLRGEGVPAGSCPDRREGSEYLVTGGHVRIVHLDGRRSISCQTSSSAAPSA